MTYQLSYEQRTIPNIVREKADENGEKTFIRQNEEELSYKEFNELSDHYARGLRREGVEKGDLVALFLSNRLEYLAIWIGLTKIGAIEVPIDRALKGDSLAFPLNHSEVNNLVTEPGFIDELKKVEDKLVSLEKLYIFDRNQVDEELENIDMLDVDALIEEGSPPKAEISPSDPFAIMYTSGTTGPPKGAVIPHAFWTYVAENIISSTGTSEEDIVFNCYPMNNPTGQVETTLRAMLANASVAHVNKFSVSSFWEEVKKFNATEIVYWGGILSLLLTPNENRGDADNPVRVAWGGGCSPVEWKEFEDRFDVEIRECYGTTEFMVPIQNTADNCKTGSIGKVCDGYNVQIVNEDDKPLGPNEIGEIVVRPNQPWMMFKGYYNEPDRTWAEMDNLWIHSGDLGYYDEEGYYYFHDRKTFAFRVNGRMVSPWQIERELNQHPKISESTAVGVPAELGSGDEIKALIVKDSSNLTPHDVIDFSEEKFPEHMVPRYVEFLDSLERTHTERVKRAKYQEEGIENAWDRRKGS